MFFAKVHAMQARFAVGAHVTVRANTRRSDVLHQHSEVAIWTTEKNGGIGLQALGLIEDFDIQLFPNDRSEGEHKEYVLTVFITALVTEPISIIDLASIRGVRDGSPLSMLDAAGYFQSHRKIKSIDEELARFLRSRFI